jgi:hypothetical protein
LSNADLPHRDASGFFIQRPRATLNLHYLFSFYGDENQLEPQRILGSVVRRLHSVPGLSNTVINNAITANLSFLAASNLAEEVEQVKFTPLYLSLDELSKIWSVFFQTPYALSVAYQASVVLVEPDLAPVSTLPVLRPRIEVVPFRQPRIESVDPQMVVFAPDALLSIRGNDLKGDDTLVQFGTQTAPPDPKSTGQRLIVTLPGGLLAGINRVQVVHRLPRPDGPAVKAFESNAAVFMLQPRLSADPVFSMETDPVTGDPLPTITVNVEPDIGQRQRVILLLNEFSPGNPAPRAYSFEQTNGSTVVDSISIPVRSAEPGTYLVRLRVDNAESLLTVDTDETSPTFGQMIGPTVTIP